MMRNIEYAINRIEQEMAELENDPLVPISRSSDIPQWLEDLAVDHEDDTTGFSEFVVSLSFRTLSDELRQRILPERISIMRADHKMIQSQKEDRVAAGDFENASPLLDQQRLLKQSIEESVNGLSLHVTPSVILDTIKALGWQ